MPPKDFLGPKRTRLGISSGPIQLLSPDSRAALHISKLSRSVVSSVVDQNCMVEFSNNYRRMASFSAKKIEVRAPFCHSQEQTARALEASRKSHGSEDLARQLHQQQEAWSQNCLVRRKSTT